MRRLALAVVAVILVAGVIAFADTNQVLSKNAVGYVRITCPAGKFVMARIDFESMGTLVMPPEVHSADIFGTQLPLGAAIYRYNPAKSGGPGYDFDNRTVLGWNTNIMYERGMGVWISVPPAGPSVSNEYQVYVLGEVPDKSSAPTTDVDIATGFTQVGYGYPATVLWTNTDLAKNSVIGDVMWWWDGTNYHFNNRTVLGWAEPNLVVTPGMAFWFQTARSPLVWTEGKPYTWP